MTAPEPKHIALVAHDDRKGDLLEWAEYNRDILADHVLYATGTTGRLLSDRLDLPVTCFQSGPLGGDQQIGALIASGDLDVLIFFWDPMSPQPHDSDVKALVRIAVVWNIPIACNRTSADYLITSPLLRLARASRGPLSGARSWPALTRPCAGQRQAAQEMVHSWPAVAAQVAISSWVLLVGPALGSVRHRPDCGLTSSPEEFRLPLLGAGAVAGVQLDERAACRAAVR